MSDFTAYDLPPEKWMKLVSPKMRLRWTTGNQAPRRTYPAPIGPGGTVNDAHGELLPFYESETPGLLDVIRGARVLIDELASRPSFATDETFEIVIERRFLLGYECILRTKSVTIKQVRTSSRDRGFEDRVEIGTITFTLS
ncbi:hypothetical protein J3R83DRAFT_3710 [Lanmaoa asiatica]|nr:hypothetical protein J3R83DRAFT_3710 [Lanmaoa asiatica]